MAKEFSASQFVAALIVSQFIAGSAFAASAGHLASKELIVRYRAPQDSSKTAFVTAAASAQGVKTVRVVNGSEGVVKLEFATQEAAGLARIKLELSGSVASVSPNLLYRPALRLSTHPVADGVAARSRASRFVDLPLSGALSASLPEVLLPPADVSYGADPLAKGDYALANINMPATAAISAELERGRPVVVAVTDTGVDYNHEDLVGGMWRHPDHPREVGYDFAHHRAKPYDVVKFDIEGCMKDPGCRFGFEQGQFLVNPGHGTHCAGHVGAVVENSLGMRGVGSNMARIMALKFFYDAGHPHAGEGDDAAAIQSIDYAIKNGAKVISASWGGRQPRDEGEKSELKAALLRARDAGVLVVIAAGNDAVDQDSVEDPSYPAAYEMDNLIVVAATDSKDRLAEFSSYGARSVHIAAPGVKILSTTAKGSPQAYSDFVARFKDPSGKTQQIDWDGTSMATPIVAGAVAAVWAKYPAESYHQIRDRILKTARKVPGLDGKVSTGGVLDVSAALGL